MFKEPETFKEKLEDIMLTIQWWVWGFWKDKYYDAKWAIWALRKYFKVVTQMRPWDYGCVIEMQEHQVKILADHIEKRSREVDESKSLKVAKMRRWLELVNNYRESNYPERCGVEMGGKWEFIETEDSKDKPKKDKCYHLNVIGRKHTDEERAECYKKAMELEKEEWEEMFQILKGTGVINMDSEDNHNYGDGTDCRGWWE